MQKIGIPLLTATYLREYVVCRKTWKQSSPVFDIGCIPNPSFNCDAARNNFCVVLLEMHRGNHHQDQNQQQPPTLRSAVYIRQLGPMNQVDANWYAEMHRRRLQRLLSTSIFICFLVLFLDTKHGVRRNNKLHHNRNGGQLFPSLGNSGDDDDGVRTWCSRSDQSWLTFFSTIGSIAYE